MTNNELKLMRVTMDTIGRAMGRAELIDDDSIDRHERKEAEKWDRYVREAEQISI
jgi:hypothetical protein